MLPCSFKIGTDMIEPVKRLPPDVGKAEEGERRAIRLRMSQPI